MDGYGRKSERIAGELRAAILAGRHRPGERIESENELAARYQVSRQTVRKALSALIGQGYLRAGRGAAGHHAYERNAGHQQDDRGHVRAQQAVYELLVFRPRLDDRGKAVDARYCPDRGQR